LGLRQKRRKDERSRKDNGAHGRIAGIVHHARTRDCAL
jgi:hypothetical protein